MGNTLINKGNFNKFIKDDSRLEIKMYGNWDKTIRTIQKLSPSIKACSIKAQLTIGRQIEKKIKDHLLYQDLKWKPLNNQYLDRKEKAGMDDRTLIGWGTYYHSIKTWQVSNHHLVMVGVRRGIYTKDTSGKRSNLEVAEIAMIHEFTTNPKKVRRPLWNPTLAEMGGARGLKALYIKHLLATLRRNGIPFVTVRGII